MENRRVETVLPLTSRRTSRNMGATTPRLKEAIRRPHLEATGITPLVLKALLHTIRAPYIPRTALFRELLRTVRRLGAKHTGPYLPTP